MKTKENTWKEESKKKTMPTKVPFAPRAPPSTASTLPVERITCPVNLFLMLLPFVETESRQVWGIGVAEVHTRKGQRREGDKSIDDY